MINIVVQCFFAVEYLYVVTGKKGGRKWGQDAETTCNIVYGSNAEQSDISVDRRSENKFEIGSKTTVNRN